MGATPWTELSMESSGWDNIQYVGARPTEYVIFGGVVMPVDGGPPVELVSWTEQSIAATPFTEGTVLATTWTEVDG